MLGPVTGGGLRAEAGGPAGGTGAITVVYFVFLLSLWVECRYVASFLGKE